MRVSLKEGLGAENVGLWWPAGHGQTRQLQYGVTVEVAVVRTQGANANLGIGEQIDSASIRVGFRTFEFVGAVDGDSGSTHPTWPLFFKFNRRPLFAKGFNFMPVDVLPLPDDPVQIARTNQVRR